MARSTVAHYKSRQDDPQGVGHDLHVDGVLTGRVNQHDNQFDVETELISVATGAQLWGKRYIRSSNDVSSLESAITSDVASCLRPQLGGGQREKLAKIGTSNGEAYQLYLKGRYHFNIFTPDEITVGGRFFEKAIELDRNYAAAYAGLADAYTLEGYYGSVPGAKAYINSRDAARRALELDSEIPESHLSLAMSDMMFFHNFSEAEASIKRALALDPNSAYSHDVSGWFASVMGRSSEAIAESRKAVELDPLSLVSNFSLSHYMARDYNQALQQANRTLEIDPKYPFAIQVIAWVNEVTANYGAAIEQWIRNEEALGNEKRAKELRVVFEKSGYRGYLRKDAKEKKAPATSMMKLLITPFLVIRMPLSQRFNERPILGRDSITSSSTQDWTAFVPTRATPNCFAA